MIIIQLERKENESAFDYHKRLVFGKLVDKTLSDIDYAELSEYVYGQPYSSDVARRMLYGSRKTIELMQESGLSESDCKTTVPELDERLVEIQKERQKFFDQRNAFNKAVRDRSRQEELNDIISRTISSGNLPSLNYHPGNIEASDNDLLVSLNDLHFGAQHSNYWGTYNSDVCAEMLRIYIDKILEIAKRHNSEKCIIWENGDVISGSIHRSIQVTNKENVIEQIMGASELIAQFISELSNHFKQVLFVSVAGNHSRIEPNKDNSLVAERLDDLVDWYLKARLQNFENVSICTSCKIDSTMYVMNIRGLNYCGIHGDFDSSASSIQSLQTMVGKPLYAVLSGHKHHNKVDVVQGIKTVMAGSFLGMDDFCIQKRIYGKPEQMVCVCDESGIVCHYDIDLDITSQNIA